MADTKPIVAVITLGVHCPKKSAPKKEKDDRTGALKVIDGEFERVELKHLKPGETAIVNVDEASWLISRGFAKDVEAPAKPAKPAA